MKTSAKPFQAATDLNVPFYPHQVPFRAQPAFQTPAANFFAVKAGMPGYKPEYQLTVEEQKMIKEVGYLAFDQQGCRNLQKRLEEGKDQTALAAFTAALIDSMVDFLPSVMMNQFGNYLCQKLIDVSSVNDIKKIIAAVMPNLI